jgi:hypothetical protein
MSATVVPIQSTEQRRNQAVADLERVASILHRAGLNVRPHHGTTEDGDPWIAFADPVTDEVIIQIDLIDGDAVGHGPAFISAFKIREIEHAAQRLLRSLKLNPTSGNITQLLLPVLVAVAVMHAAEADADGWLPLDAQNIIQAPVLATMAAVVVVAKVVQAASETVHDMIETLITSPDAEVPAGDEGDDQAVSLEAPIDVSPVLATLEPAEAISLDMVTVAINADVPSLHEDHATESIAFAPLFEGVSEIPVPAPEAPLRTTS